jgi:hypothetical protein
MSEHEKLHGQDDKTSVFQPLFEHLSHVMTVSRKKFDYVQARNADKLKWGRLLIAAAEAFGKLYEASKIDELEERLERLEEKR